MTVCPICGKQFIGRYGRVYCSVSCRFKAKNIPQNGYVQKTFESVEPKTDCFAYTEEECRAMKKGFFPCKVGECRFYKKGDWEMITNYRKCLYCGNMFIPPNHNMSVRFCSDECRREYLNVKIWTNVRKETI